MSDRNDRAESPLRRRYSALNTLVEGVTGTNVPTEEASNVTEIVTLHDPMTHDPLCGGGDCDCTCDQMQDGHRVTCIYLDCECDLIARVREDERLRHADGWPQWCTNEIRRAARRDAVEAVSILLPEIVTSDTGRGYAEAVTRAIAAIQELNKGDR